MIRKHSKFLWRIQRYSSHLQKSKLFGRISIVITSTISFQFYCQWQKDISSEVVSKVGGSKSDKISDHVSCVNKTYFRSNKALSLCFHIYSFCIGTKQLIAPMDRPVDKISTQQLGKLIGEFWQKHKEKGKNFTVKHFLEFDISKRSIYRYIDRHETWWTTDRKKGSGVITGRWHTSKSWKCTNVSITTEVSRRKMASKLDLSTICAGTVLKKFLIKFWCQEKVPQSTPQQMKNQKRCLNKLRSVAEEPGSDYGRRVIFHFQQFSIFWQPWVLVKQQRTDATGRKVRWN